MAYVVVREVKRMPKQRVRQHGKPRGFGETFTIGGNDRVHIQYMGHGYWVDDDMLARPEEA